MNTSKAHRSALPTIRQLPLPFLDTEPMSRHLPTQVVFLSPQQIWVTLPLAARLGVRATLLRVLQEVLNDGCHS